MAEELKRPLPKPSPEALPFWEGLKEDKFLLQRCDDCSAINWFPRHACYNCGGEQLSWTPAKGTGKLETYSIIHKPMNEAWKDQVPYVLAWVKLDEGINMVTRLVWDQKTEPVIDAQVEVRFVEEGEFKLPFFEQV